MLSRNKWLTYTRVDPNKLEESLLKDTTREVVQEEIFLQTEERFLVEDQEDQEEKKILVDLNQRWSEDTTINQEEEDNKTKVIHEVDGIKEGAKEIIEIEMTITKREAEEDMVVAAEANLIKVPRYLKLLRVRLSN